MNNQNLKSTNRRSHPRPRREITIPTLFQLVIQCRDENQQRQLYEQLTAAGYACKVTTL